MEKLNPYASSIQEDNQAPSSLDEAEFEKLSYISWIALVAFNIPMPLFFGFSITSSLAKIGVALAFAPMLVFGYWICSMPGKRGKPLFIGGIIVALFQFFPLLQMLAGMAAIAIAGPIDDFLTTTARSENDSVFHFAVLNTIIGGFVATLITGTILIMTSAAVGYAIRYSTPEKWWQSASTFETQ